VLDYGLTTWRSGGALKASSVEFIDENGGGAGVHL
jgi:hypothetical protein